MEELIITAIGKDKTGIVNELCSVISRHNGNILDSHMAVLGQDFTIQLLVDGDNAAIVRIEQAIAEVSQSNELLTMMKRTSSHKQVNYAGSALVQFAGIDREGIVSAVTEFFAGKSIDLYSLRFSSFKDATTDAQMSKASMVVNVPKDLDCDALQTEFDDLTDKLDLLASLDFR